MGGAAAGDGSGAGSVICFGEALVDFVSEERVDDVTQAPSFAPRFGGSVANIAVGAARFGAHTAMLGGAGADAWGRFLRDTLAAEGVDVTWFPLLDGAPTTHTFVAVSDEGEPSYAFYGGEGRELGVVASAEHLDESLGAAGAGVLVFGSDTLHGAREREATMRARDRARAAGWLVLYDPNLRPMRWADHEEMREVALAALPGATLVKANLDEARLLSGSDDAARAARALVEAGARAVVITRGAEGLLVVVGDDEPVKVAPVSARVVDATGAGDSVAAVLAVALARTGDPAAIPVAAQLAVRTAAGVTGAHGALAGLPEPLDARKQIEEALRA